MIKCIRLLRLPMAESGNYTVFAFDRDKTVTSGLGAGPIGLDLIKQISNETKHEIWAIGNQRLKDEANIPGITELIDYLEITSNERKAELRSSKRKRILALSDLYSEADRYIVVDDKNFDDLEDHDWLYYQPEEFVRNPPLEIREYIIKMQEKLFYD